MRIRKFRVENGLVNLTMERQDGKLRWSRRHINHAWSKVIQGEILSTSHSFLMPNENSFERVLIWAGATCHGLNVFQSWRSNLKIVTTECFSCIVLFMSEVGIQYFDFINLKLIIPTRLKPAIPQPNLPLEKLPMPVGWSKFSKKLNIALSFIIIMPRFHFI